jgi:heterodisulfide reductase subunit A
VRGLPQHQPLRNAYCSSVCCMYAIKQSLVTAEHLTGVMTRADDFLHGHPQSRQGVRAILRKRQKTGVRFVRAGRIPSNPGRTATGVQMRYTTEDGQTHEEGFDMAVLSIGLEAPADALDLADRFGLELDPQFCPHLQFRSGAQQPGGGFRHRRLPGTQGDSALRGRSLGRRIGRRALLTAAKGSLTHIKPIRRRWTLRATPGCRRFRLFLRHQHRRSGRRRRVAEYARSLPNVVHVENNLFTCSADTQDMIAEKIREHNLNRIVIAACTPRTHEPLFQDTLQEAGLNPYLVEMANIRNQNAWVHQNEPDRSMAVATSQGQGSGAHGRCQSAQGEDIRSMLTNMIDQVENHPRIKVLKNATLQSATGSVGNFVSKVSVNGDMQAVTYGVAVVATGGKESVPDEYLHGDDSRVLTHLAFDRLLQENPSLPAQVNSVAFIQCVGSREARRPYCSRVCCTHSIQAAVDLKERNPALQVTILYRDIRTYGKREDLYQKARRLGVLFIRYDVDDKPQVTAEREGLWIGTRDPILQQPVRIFADYLVLAAAIEPHKNTELIDLYKCAADADGFLNEAHPKLRPVDMSVEGLYVAGLCNYPKPIDESIGQAMAAASRAGVILNQEEIMLDAIKSFVTDQCDGCALCLDVCPYRAIALEAYEDDSGQPHKRIKTDPALCKGCGVCAATCPKGGVHVHGFTMEQLKAQVAAALHG